MKITVDSSSSQPSSTGPYAGLRLTKAREQAKPVAPSPAKAATATPAPPIAKPATSGHDLKVAQQNARMAERKRWETVMMSGAAKGRENMAATLLAKGEWPASEIIANLPSLHAECAMESSAQKAAESAAVWDRAIANISPSSGAAGTAKRDDDAISAMIDRNIAKLFPGQGS